MNSLISLDFIFVMKQCVKQLLILAILTRKTLFMPQNRNVPDIREKRRSWKKTYVGEQHKSSGLSGRKRGEHQYDTALCQSTEKPESSR